MERDEEEEDPEFEVEEIVEALQELGHNSEELDEIVESAALDIAKDVNKYGLAEQVAFLLDNGWEFEDILDFLGET